MSATNYSQSDCPICKKSLSGHIMTSCIVHWNCIPTEPAIPISVINAKIAELEIDNNYCYECGIDYQNYVREILEEIKKQTK